jgi:hypothetical protein
MFLQNLFVCSECDMLQRMSALSPGESATLDALWTARCAKKNQSRAGRTSVHEYVQGNG